MKTIVIEMDPNDEIHLIVREPETMTTAHSLLIFDGILNAPSMKMERGKPPLITFAIKDFIYTTKPGEVTF